ncbi:MAG TPA: MFS transporter, partial [Symbiobacteriaceae bacterium]|nr:MFS transporter [Symbiobacteriaceae bacterium]
MTPRSTMAVACSGFLALGIIIASLGPALPDLARATGAPLAALGGLLSLIFAGGLAAQLISGPLTDRLGSRPVLTGGLFLLGLGTLGLVLSHVTWLTFASAAILGLGHGTIGVSFSLLVARTFPQRTVSALNLLNLFFGVGAIMGPAFASYLIRSVGSALPALWLGITVVAVALPFCLRLPNHAETTGKAAPSASSRLVGIPAFWLLGALLLTYVGVESGVAAWTTTYMQTVAGQSQATGALLTSGFWGAVTVGRLVVTLIGSRFSPATVLCTTLAGAAGGGLLLAFSGTSTVLIAAAIL